MRFLALALFVAAAATCCLARDDVQELVNQANEAGAPLTEAALKRLQDSGLWGTQRANRTTDAIILNSSKRNFTLTFDKCALGLLTTGLLPENQIQSASSSVYGMDSSNSKYPQGVQCTVVYQDPQNNSYFSIMLDNPYTGDNAIYTTSSYDLLVFPTLGHGTSNEARITVQSIGPWPMLSSSRSAGSKQKRRRNIAIKASKSGSRYHTL